MDDPTKELQDLFIMRPPPDPDTVREIAERLEAWGARYLAWHQELMRAAAAATLARHRQLLSRLATTTEAEAIATLRSEDGPPMIEGEDGKRYDATEFYDSMKKLHDAACIVSKATDAYLDAFQAVDTMLGDADVQGSGGAARPLRSLAEILASALIPFSCEVARLEQGTALVMSRLGRHPDEPVSPELAIAEHVALLARAGHSDAAIARVLSKAFPGWASTAELRARTEAGGVSAPKLETRRVLELLIERVRKMRTERGVAAGREVRSGKVDPLKGLAEIVEQDPEAHD